MADFKRNVVAEVETRTTGTSFIGDLVKEIDRLGDEVGRSAGKVNKLEKETGQLSRENAKLERALREARGELDKFVKTGKNVPQLSKSFSSLKSIIAGLGIVSVSQALKESVSLIASFGGQMAKVRAVSGATDEQIAQLTARARELGATTKFTGFEAAEGMEELARAGFRTEEIIVAAGGALTLAASSAVELSTAAEIGSGSLRAFNLSADHFQRVVDVIAKTSASSAVNVESFGESTKEGGAIAVQAGVSLEEFAAAMGIAGNSMIRGTRFGTAFKNAIAKLENVTPKAERALNRYGLTAEDVSVKQHGFTTVMERLSNANLSTSDSFDVLGKIAAPTIGVLTNNVDGIKRLHEELNNATGSSDKMAEIMSNNLAGSFKTFVSAFQEVILQLGEGLSPSLKDAVDEVTNFLRSIGGLETVGKIIGTVITAIQILVKKGVAETRAIALAIEEVLSGMAQRVAKFLDVLSKAAEFIGKENIATNLQDTATRLREVVKNFQDNIRRDTIEGLKKSRESIAEDLKLLIGIWSETGKEVKESGEEIKKGSQGLKALAAAVEEAASDIVGEGKVIANEVERILQSVLGITTSAAEIIAKKAPALREAIEEIGLDQINFGLTPEQKERLKKELEEVISAARSVGKKLDPVLTSAAASLGIIVGAYETVTPAIIGFTKATERSIEAQRKSTEASAEQASSTRALADTQVVVRERIDETGKKIREIVQVQKRATDSHRGLASAAAAAAGALREESQAVSEGASASSDAGTSAETFSEDLKKLGAAATKAAGEVSGVGQGANEAASGLSDAADTANTASGDLESAAASVKASGDALGEQAQAAGDASGGLQKMASSSASATESQDQMRASVEKVKTEIVDLKTAISEISSLQVSLDLSAVVDEIKAVKKELRDLMTLATQTRQEVESVAVAAEAS